MVIFHGYVTNNQCSSYIESVEGYSPPTKMFGLNHCTWGTTRLRYRPVPPCAPPPSVPGGTRRTWARGREMNDLN